MPDVVRLRNIGPVDLDVGPLGRVVGADHVVDLPGSVTDDSGDCYLIDSGAAVRAWPKTTWRVEPRKGKG